MFFFGGGGPFLGGWMLGAGGGSIVMRWLLGHLGCSARRGLVRGISLLAVGPITTLQGLGWGLAGSQAEGFMGLLCPVHF